MTPTVADLMPKIQIAYKGKGAAGVPTKQMPQYAIYLSIANDALRLWAEDTEVNWPSLFKTVDLPIVSGLVTLPDDFVRLSDQPTVEGKLMSVVPFTQRNAADTNSVYVAGTPPTLTFTGYNTGTAKVGYIAYPPELVSNSSEVVCDSLDWLAVQTAAILAEKDPSRDDTYPELVQQANQKYKIMVARAKKLPAGSNRAIRSSYPTLGRSW